MATTRLHDLAAVIDALEGAGRLARVTSAVDPRHELAGIAHRLEGAPRAVLFESVKGQRWPVLAGLYWNRAVIAGLFGTDEKSLPHTIAAALERGRAAPLDPVLTKTGPVLDVTENDVDLGKIPAPVQALSDGWPIFDGIVIAKDPHTSERAALLCRFEATGRDTLQVHAAQAGLLATYLEKARRLDRSLWVTLNCGVGPALHLAAASPFPISDAGALAIAGALAGTPLQLVPGTESDVEMAAAAMWALECEIAPAAKSGAAPPRLIAHVRKVHRRAQPVFHALLPGLETGVSAGLLGEARALTLLRQQISGITDIHVRSGGAGVHHAIVQIAQQRAGWPKQAILAAFAAFPPLKMVTVVDDDIDIRNGAEVEWAMAARFDPARDVVRIDNAFDGLTDTPGSKIGFDATQPFPKQPGHERHAFKAVTMEAHEIAVPGAGRAVQTAAAPPPSSSPTPGPAAGDDTDRIRPREIAGRTGDGNSAEVPTVKPDSTPDWDETRWLERELAAMKRGPAAPAPSSAGSTAPPEPDRSAKPESAGHAFLVRKTVDWDEGRWLSRQLEEMQREAARAAPAQPPAPMPPASSDWDETRWLARELEEMKRQAAKRDAAPPAKPSPPKPVPPKPVVRAAAPKPEPVRAVESRPPDDEDGGFFHSGTA